MAVTPGPRLVDADSKGLVSASFQKFYSAEKPTGITVEGSFIGPMRPPILPTGEIKILPTCQVHGRLEVADDEAETRYDAIMMMWSSGVIVTPMPGVHRWATRLAVPDLTARLKAFETPPKTLPALEAASLADYRALLAQFTKGEPTDSQWLTPKLALETAEAIRRDPPGGYFRASSGVACEFWLTVPTADAKTQCRVQIPAVPAGQKVPVVVALHGVGGSEHMFPEAYGAGCLAKAASDAGFALVCPHGALFGAPPVPEILAELAKRFPIDTAKVHLVGHSLGASQAAELAQRPGQNYESVTLLAGGGRVRDADKLNKTRLFLAAGDADFAAKSTRKFHAALQTAGVEPKYREYPGVEHLTIVRYAVDDVAKFWAKK